MRTGEIFKKDLRYRHRLGGLAVWIILAAVAAPALADEPIVVQIDKVSLVRPETASKVVMITNPNIADAVMEKSDLIFLIGKEVGETQLLLLDGEGEEILNQAVVVVPPGPRHVSVHRNSEEAILSCAPRCVVIEREERGRPPSAASAAAPAAPAPAGPGAASGAAPAGAPAIPDATIPPAEGLEY